jgi:adenylate cyclase
LFSPGLLLVADGARDFNRVMNLNAAYEQVRDKLKEEFIDLGEQSLKNIARPVRVYRVTLNRSAAKTEPALALPDKPSIAVLPFNNMSGDPSQEFFADGIAEDITTLLSRLPDFFVIARNSTFTYKGRAVDTRQVARELGVRYVLEGSVQKAGQRARVTAQLIEANSGNQNRSSSTSITFSISCSRPCHLATKPLFRRRATNSGLGQ